MKIRRFYSKSMRLALQQVTDEFGDDAAIISSKKTSTGVEVIAALDYDQELMPSQVPIDEATQSTEAATTKNENSASDILDDKKETKLELSNKTKTSGEYEVLSNSFKSNPIAAPLFEKSQHKNNNLEWTTDPGLVAMKEELGLMRVMMSEQLKGLGWERFNEKDPTGAMLTRRFSSLGINTMLANQLIPLVKQEQDIECSWQNLLALLAKSVNINCQKILSDGGVFAFMGPTGSGKTTTIAKIAARFVIKNGVDSVGLISTDNYRISAQQQLGNFAKLLGIQMMSVSNANPVEDILNKFKHKKLVLIDTAGMSRNDVAIAKQLDNLKNCHKDIKRFLMIPATNQLAVQKQSLELFRRYSPFSVIITKIDEAASLGEVISLVVENNLPVAFTTDGQRVPEDIKLARNHDLVSKAVWLTNKYGTNTEDWKLAQEKQIKYA
jgi:flagellar biosynthesis protein FlhF